MYTGKVRKVVWNWKLTKFKLHFVFFLRWQIQIQEDDLTEALAIASELGLEELMAIHEQQIIGSLSVHNVCAYLESVTTIKGRLQENQWNRLVHASLQFFSENATECVKT